MQLPNKNKMETALTHPVMLDTSDSQAAWTCTTQKKTCCTVEHLKVNQCFSKRALLIQTREVMSHAASDALAPHQSIIN